MRLLEESLEVLQPDGAHCAVDDAMIAAQCHLQCRHCAVSEMHSVMEGVIALREIWEMLPPIQEPEIGRDSDGSPGSA